MLTGVFSDGESRIEIQSDMRGCDVFVIQPLKNPANHHIVELCLTLDALKRASAKRVTAVIPYFGYARQDRKIEPRTPISAKAIANLISASGIDRLLTIDLHAGQIQGFFDVPVDNLYASKIFLKHLPDDPENTCIVSPDIGGSNRANHYSKKLGCDLAIVHKHREKANEVAEMRLIGDVRGKNCFIVDDMADTSGTLCKCADLLKDNGAESINAMITHGVFSGGAIEKINQSCFDKVFVSDTIPQERQVLMNNKFEVVTVADLFAQAIYNIHNEVSVSSLFV